MPAKYILMTITIAKSSVVLTNYIINIVVKLFYMYNLMELNSV